MRLAPFIILSAVALLGATLPVVPAASAPTWAERLFLDTGALSPEEPLQAFDSTKRTIFDLDGDGLPEIIAHNDNSRVYVIRGADGVLVSELSTIHPKPWGARDINDIAVGDVDGNGRIDLVVANSVGYVTVFELKAEQPDIDRLHWEKRWERKYDPREIWPDITTTRPGYDWTAVFPGMDGGAYLADVDKSGKLTIFVQNDNMPGFLAIRHDGSLRWASDRSDGNANPWVDDLDNDGRLEAIFVSDGGGVYIHDAASGATKGSFHAKTSPGCPAQPGAISVSPGVADLDGDGVKEIFFGSRQADGTEDDAKSAAWRDAQDARIYAVNPYGGLKWCFTAPWLGPHVYMHPAVVDIDGDGRRDAIFIEWNTIGHKPGSWEVVNPPHIFVLNGNGHLLWVREVRIGWSNKDVAVADVDGDGQQEILLADERGGKEGILMLTLGGKEKGFVPTRWGVSRGPQVADLDGDGFLEVLVPVWRGAPSCPAARDVGCREGALQVFATKGREAAFPGVFYFNHEYEVDYDGKAPKRPEPPAKTPYRMTGVLYGTVSDDDGPLEGATIVVTVDGASYEGKAHAGGAFALRAPGGRWSVTVSAFGHETATFEVDVVGARATELNATLNESPVIGLLPNFLNPVPVLGILGAMVAAGFGIYAYRHRRSAGKP